MNIILYNLYQNLYKYQYNLSTFWYIRLAQIFSFMQLKRRPLSSSRESLLDHVRATVYSNDSF